MYAALALALLFSVADWIAVARQKDTLRYFFKPAATFAVISVAWLMAGTSHDAWQWQWFIPGFFFCLLGDVFLIPPGKRWFIFGLGAFLVGLVLLTIGLNPDAPPLAALPLLLPLTVGVGFVIWRVVASLRADDHSSLILPVIIYGIAMTLLVFSAWATLFRADWSDVRRMWIITGATLFVISDAMLAWNRFVKPFAAANLAVIITYHIAIITAALSIQT